MKNISTKIIIIVFTFFLGIGNVFAINTAKVIPKKDTAYQVPILVYHSFGPTPIAKESKSKLHYRVTATKFEEQMKYLSTNGYHPISFASYVANLKNENKLPEKSVVLAFDDGWKSQYQYAIPILEKYNFTATFFIITSYTDNNYKAYMSWDDLKDLVAHDFDIESHTKNHPILTKVTAKQLAIELTESKKILEEKLKIKVTTLAYPNYMQNSTVRSAVKLAGYLGARAGWGSFNNSSLHIYELKSQEVVNNGNPFFSKRLPDLP
ncbi:MAG: polysaccharide deacetylase family protein [bacterium]